MSNIAMDKQTNMPGSVLRALDILEYMMAHPGAQSIAALCRAHGVNRVTMSGLLEALRHKGYLSRERDGRYNLTSRLFELGTHYQARFPLVHLVERCRLGFLDDIPSSVKLTVLTDELRALILYFRSTETEVLRMPVGYAMPLQTSACGKVLLAFGDPALADRFLEENEFQRFTPHTNTDKAAYRKELRDARERGFALDLCEYYEELICIAAPIFDAAGTLAGALSVSGAERDFRPQMQPLIAGVTGAARRLSSEMGWRAGLGSSPKAEAGEDGLSDASGKDSP